jgi:hypothetical protein
MSREEILNCSSRLIEHGTNRQIPTLRLRFLENRSSRLRYENRRRLVQ